jgi:uncharacterized protein (TIGR02271 family)
VIDQSQAKQLIGQQLRTRNGDKIGTIGQVYIDDYHGQPEWVTVNTGLFGTSESFVPLAEATVSGNDLVVPYTKAQIKDAPKISESGRLTEAEEQDLYEHYNLAYTTEGSTFADTTGAGTGTGTGTDRAQSTGRTGSGYTGTTNENSTSGYDTSGTSTDSAMTRSEEQLNVGTERVQTGKARLRKWIETENVQVDVPIRTEKAVLVTEPVTDANRGDALDGPEISEDEHEVVLNTERPVVAKETVAKERVRLDTQVEESTETVNDEVRKERIELEDDARTSRAAAKKH